MQIKTEIMTADRTSPVVQKGEYIPNPIQLNDDMTIRQFRDLMASYAWCLQRVYNLANSKRECRSVVFSFTFESITGKPSCVKD